MNPLWGVAFTLLCLSILALGFSDLVVRPMRIWLTGGQYVFSRPAERGQPARHRKPGRSHRAVRA